MMKNLRYLRVILPALKFSFLKFSFLVFSFLAPSFLASSLAYAEANITIKDAWIRASTPGQKIGAAYMTIKSNENVEMVYAETARAGSVEMHSMTMHNGVMKMRMLASLTVNANQAVSLAPGGLHLMLFDLNTPFKAGEKVSLRLCFKNSAGKILEQTMTIPVKENP